MAIFEQTERYDHNLNGCFSFAPRVDLLQVSLAEKTGKGKKRQRLVILGMLIDIHGQSSPTSIFKNDGIVVNCFIEA